jgi:2-hydroxychromene-2-carboxylate isomerase
VGQLISLTDKLAERRQEQDHVGTGHAAFFFAMDCPVSYLVAERVERDLGNISWMPVLSAGAQPWGHERLRHARDEARLHRLPLVEPDNYPFDVRPVTRAAVFAALNGAGAGFATAAMRLAFAGGFDISDADILAEAASAAGLDEDKVLRASEQETYDTSLAVTSRGLRSVGVIEAPALRICGDWFTGLDALMQSSEFTAARASYRALDAAPIAPGA